MIKIFISQPMKDKTDEEILLERAEVEAKLTLEYGDDVEFIDSFMQGAPHDAKPLWFLGKSLQFLSEADAIYMCKGWEYARGCLIEHRAAQLYDIRIILG